VPLNTREQVTPGQLSLAKRAWDIVGRRNVEHFLVQLAGMPKARREISRLHDRAVKLAGTSALRLFGMEPAATEVARAAQALEAALQAVTVERVRAAKEQLAGLRTRFPAAPRRGRGGTSRTVEFVRLMLKLEPTLPRRPGWWLALDDVFPVSPNSSVNRQQRRDYWKTVLRRVEAKRTKVRRDRNPARVRDPESRAT
jgi:hypothetical protein